MDKYPKDVRLKNGTNIVLRMFTDEDMELLISFFQNLPTKDRMYLRIDVMQRENILRRYGNVNYDLMFPVLALSDSKVIAIGTLYRPAFGWMRNLGEIRVVVAPKFQRLGLCTILTKELFFHALTTDLFKIQAELMEDQKSALSCFEKLGFKQEAILKKHVSDIEGNRCNLILMSLDIQEMWLLMEDFIDNLMPH